MTTNIQSKPLVIGLPGSFDSAGYASYRNWLEYFPELGVEVRILDMLQLPGIEKVGDDARGSVYYCDWYPDDYVDLITATIDELQPSETIFVGFGFGAYEAVRAAFALSMLGRPIAGVVAITPNFLTYTNEIEGFPKRPEAELVRSLDNGILSSRSDIDVSSLMSCLRYENLREPEDGAISTFYVPEQVPLRYCKEPVREDLPSATGGRQSLPLYGLNRMLSSPQYTVPTVLMAASEGRYLPSSEVRELARYVSYAPVGMVEVPGVCYDFRAFPEQVERVTETLMDKVGQLLTTRTVHSPRPSHTLLLRSDTVAEQSIGTIVLSSARAPYHHRPAVQLAKDSGAKLAVLASHDLDVDIVAADMARSGVKGCIIDVPTAYSLPLMEGFATSKHRAVADRVSNLSVKRNIGLLLGYLADQKILLLDDDIRGLTAQSLRQVGGQLDKHVIAGFSASTHPDNSVVCHANRLAGGDQGVYISGGSLGVNATTIRSFFPHVYNEDWLFCHDAVSGHDVVLLGNVLQLPYDPYSAERAASEEFGDILAEGLNYLLSVDLSPTQAGKDFWGYYLWRRRRFIDDIVRRLSTLPKRSDNQIAEALVALRASSEQLADFNSQDFVSYVGAWRDDTERWCDLLDRLPRHVTFDEAIEFISRTLAIPVRLVNP
jgi:pimeloyl-ACP methyl ester carboxylesterase